MNDSHRVVSSESEELILVDRNDKEIGSLSKAECHNGGGVLHRAFSLFLWPAFWSNSCCSHPRRGESMETATRRRLSDELNVEASLEHVYWFCYTAGFGEAGSENELCHVYLGRISATVQPNDSEIAAVRFVSAGDLDDELAQVPERFTPWFKQEWQELTGNHRDRLARYCDLG